MEEAAEERRAAARLNTAVSRLLLVNAYFAVAPHVQSVPPSVRYIHVARQLQDQCTRAVVNFQGGGAVDQF